MENQEPTYSTQKEEPVMPAPPPSAFPTPAHPLPKFLPKPIALIVIVLIIGALLSGLVFTVYTLGRNSVFKELNPTAPAIPSPDPVFYEPTPTPALDETADWQTYLNAKYGFSFKYPKTWVFIEGPVGMTKDEWQNASYVDLGYKPSQTNPHSISLEFQVSVRDVKIFTDNTDENLKRNIYDQFPSSKNDNFKYENINGNKFISFINKENDLDPGWKYMYIQKDNKIYSIVLLMNNDLYNKSFSIYDQILSTFKFE